VGDDGEAERREDTMAHRRRSRAYKSRLPALLIADYELETTGDAGVA